MDLVYVTYELPSEGTVTWTVVDQSGRRVMSGTLGGAKGSNRFDLPMHKPWRLVPTRLDVIQGAMPVGGPGSSSSDATQPF